MTRKTAIAVAVLPFIFGCQENTATLEVGSDGEGFTPQFHICPDTYSIVEGLNIHHLDQTTIDQLFEKGICWSRFTGYIQNWPEQFKIN